MAHFYRAYLGIFFCDIWMLVLSCLFATCVFRVSLAQITTIATNLTSNTTDIPLSSVAFSVVQVVIVAIGLFLLLFASFKLTKLIKQYHSASAVERTYFLSSPLRR